MLETTESDIREEKSELIQRKKNTIIEPEIYKKIEGNKIEDSITLSQVKSEAEELKKRIIEVKIERRHMYVQCIQIEQIIKILNNIFIFITAIFSFVNIDESYRSIFSIISAILSVALWSNYTKKAEEYLIHSNDLQSAEEIVEACSKKISDIQSDGIVTKDEQVQISKIILDLDVQLGTLSTCSRLIRLVSDVTSDTDIKQLYGNFKTITEKYNSQQTKN